MQPSAQPRLVCLAEKPYWITHANGAWLSVMGHSQEKVKLSTVSVLNVSLQATRPAEPMSWVGPLMGSPAHSSAQDPDVTASMDSGPPELVSGPCRRRKSWTARRACVLHIEDRHGRYKHMLSLAVIGRSWRCPGARGETFGDARAAQGPPEANNGTELDAFIHSCVGLSPKRAGMAEMYVVSANLRRFRAALQVYPLGSADGALTHFLIVMEEVPVCAALSQAPPTAGVCVQTFPGAAYSDLLERWSSDICSDVAFHRGR